MFLCHHMIPSEEFLTIATLLRAGPRGWLTDQRISDVPIASIELLLQQGTIGTEITLPCARGMFKNRQCDYAIQNHLYLKIYYKDCDYEVDNICAWEIQVKYLFLMQASENKPPPDILCFFWYWLLGWNCCWNLLNKGMSNTAQNKLLDDCKLSILNFLLRGYSKNSIDSSL